MRDGSRPSAIRTVAVLQAVFAFVSPASAADWPTWRHDANRSAATDEKLPATRHLQWVRKFPRPRPAWPGQYDLEFDAVYEPIVLGKVLYVPSSRNDSITAVSTETGDVLWQYLAGGPVRLAPVGHDGRIYFGCDDGHIYCLDAGKGTLLWKYDAAPSRLKVLGNDRLISLWPIRGGPVLKDGRLYFTSGIWQFEGVFLNSLDLGGARSGPPSKHASVKIDGHPQGYLAAAAGKILIPVNRRKPGIVEANIGKARPPSGRAVGIVREKCRGCFVAGAGPWIFHVGGVYRASSPDKPAMGGVRRPVFAGDVAYAPIHPGRRFEGEIGIQAIGLKGAKPTVLWKLVEPVKIPAALKGGSRARWVRENPLRIDLLAGSRLYGRQAKTVFAVDLPSGGARPRVSWSVDLEDTPGSMFAADGKLFVSTREGALYCFGGKKVQLKTHEAPPEPPEVNGAPPAGIAGGALDRAGVQDGWCLVLGIGSGRLVEEIAGRSKMRVIGIDPDAKRVEALRRKLVAARIYGTRVSVHAGHPLSFGLPPYLASLIVSENLNAAGFDRGPKFVKEVFRVLRPYGGAACLAFGAKKTAFSGWVAQAKLPNAKLDSSGGFTVLRREGPLVGAGSWTHEFGDAANTLMSGDKLVRGPLGVLWFGGPAGRPGLFWDRHLAPPSALVSGGRMIFQGAGVLTAADVYTGRVLWQAKLPRDRKHRGYLVRTAAAPDAIYVACRDKCLKLDPVSGKTAAEFSLPTKTDVWNAIRVQDDLLLVLALRKISKDKFSKYLASGLVALDRRTGEVRWKQPANSSLAMLTLAPDRAYGVDSRIPVGVIGRKIGKMDRGFFPEKEGGADGQRLRAFDLKTGRPLWETHVSRPVQWLSYSRKHDVLVASDHEGLTAFRGKDGEKLWEQACKGKGFGSKGPSTRYMIILWKDWIVRQADHKAYHVETGRPRTASGSTAGKDGSWQFQVIRNAGGCGYAVAGEHLLTLRQGYAAYCDTVSGAIRLLKGFRSGCRNSLLPADGVLCAPNFARGCVCNYGVFTSLALVPRPARQGDSPARRD